jgi:hypothetical protein
MCDCHRRCAIAACAACARTQEAEELWSAVADDVPPDSPLVGYTAVTLAMVRCRPSPPTEEAAAAFTMAHDRFANALARDPELEQVRRQYRACTLLFFLASCVLASL